jgi:hypothetical protein
LRLNVDIMKTREPSLAAVKGVQVEPRAKVNPFAMS